MGLEESPAPSFVDSEEAIRLQPSKIKPFYISAPWMKPHQRSPRSHP